MNTTMENTHNDLPLTAAVPPPLPDLPAALKKRSIIGIISGLALIGFLLCCAVGIWVSIFDVENFSPSRITELLDPLILIILAPIAFFGILALRQYMSLFCCPPWQSRFSHTTSFVFGGFCLFMFTSCLIEVIASGEFGHHHIHRILPFFKDTFIAAVLFLGIGEVNRRSTNRRRKLAADFSLPLSLPMTVKLRAYKGRLGIGIVLLCAAAALMVSPLQPPPKSGEHLSYAEFPYKSFPSAGTDFSYKRGYRGTMEVEFTIEEDALKKWLAEDDDRWEPIQEGAAGFSTHYEPDPARHNGGEVRIHFDRATRRAHYRQAYH